MFPGHFRWDPAMELVKESPPPLIPAKAGTGHAIKRGLCGVPDITRIAANGSIFIRSDGTAGAFGDLCEPGGHLAFPRPSGEYVGPPRQGLPFSYTAKSVSEPRP